MEIQSRLVADVPGGVALDTTLDGESISTYVVTGVTDLNAIADIVPREKVDAGADIHAANVDDVDNAQEQIDQVLENMNPGDVAVFLCADADAFGAALDLLGLPIDE
ncbi:MULTISPECIES: hypothetical protein [unclassified Achromobacter]|uniref:hypothetical protein n=1 Tax=unclassified Achromobacter TaxID=2626865 RepID=UPI00069D5AAA|nr:MULTISPECIES: hypothetical protein [unclassified Achromobacter]KOF53576.1 hypothetical protein AD428_12655 [Achromobacter sp. DMS1]